MVPHDFTEEQLVERPAVQLFSDLKWTTVSALEEVFGPGGTLGRETAGEVVLVARLRAALVKLNGNLPAAAITAAIDELTRDRSAMSLVAANREVTELIRDGVPVIVPDPATGGEQTERVRVVNWSEPEGNDFLLVSQMTFVGPLYTRRPDLVGFVNGLPLVVVEFKKPGVPAREAYDDNLTCYMDPLDGVPALFWTNAFLIASNGTESRVGSITADWDRFFEWKRIEREDEPKRVSLEVMIRGTCDRTRMLDLVENFTLFSEHKSGLVKVLAQNHQVLGVNGAIDSALAARAAGHGRGGVFWQTQGSGKSFAMIFFAQKILRKHAGNWTFVVVTDRDELDLQIAKTFKACGAVSEAEGKQCHATSGAHLRQLLAENHRYVFTLIHKFRSADVLCDRGDVIVLADEAHRSQYDTLALNMRAAMPNAIFLAFTGTPLIAGEERTRSVFGEYVSRYTFQDATDDGATVRLFYENRTPELHLDNPELNENLYDLIEAAGLDDEQEKRLERELGRQYHLITRDDRLETIAKDLVQHFLGRGFLGKAMVVSIDKATALRMHDKVRKHWASERVRVEKEIEQLRIVGDASGGDRLRELEARRDVLVKTDMALIVSAEQHETERMAKLGLDIVPHRKRMNDEGLDEKFKDAEDPLRIVFLCAMWLTGFDAPSCSTVYLDKPMRNHTLMQTIARANRVFPGKHSGLIVDYANVFASLEQALAIYGTGRGGLTPVRDKAEPVAELRAAVTAATTYCAARGVDIGEIVALDAGNMARLERIVFAVEALIGPDATRKEFLGHEKLARALYQAVKPDPAVLEFVPTVACLATIADSIRERTGEGKPADVSAVLADVNRLLDDSIAADGFCVRERPDDGSSAIIDLSKIDFEALAKRFAKSRTKQVDIEQLKAAIRTQLERMIRINRTRTDYLARFEELIDSYNAGSRNLDELFKELVALSRSLSEEESRHVRENLTEEELVVLDILTRPSPELSTDERAEVKRVARVLLGRLKDLLVLNWRQKAAARAQVKGAIEDVLDRGLPRAYTPAVYKQKCTALFEHFYESYPESGPARMAEAG